MPAVDRPVGKVDGREVDMGVVCSLPIAPRSPATTLPLLLSQTMTKDLQEKRNVTR